MIQASIVKCPLAGSKFGALAMLIKRGILLSPSASAGERLTALKFLAHWVGDIHQPLHVSFADDKGGNRIILERGIGCRKTLHDVWDNCIPEDLMEESDAGQDRRRFAEKLHGEITDADRQKWTSKMSLAQWANESYAIARELRADGFTIGKRGIQMLPSHYSFRLPCTSYRPNAFAL